MTRDYLLKNAKGLADDSRNVEPGFVFFCKGNHFKKEYLDSAVEKGAIAYYSEEDYGDLLPKFIVPDVKKAIADFCKDYYDDPSSKLKLAGITGTKGKSTILYYLRSIMSFVDATKDGKFGFVSTIENYDGSTLVESHLTTPESIELNTLLSNMVKNNIHYAGMEVSSQGLKYKRVDGLQYEIGCFTNFSKDHISPIEHSDIDDYFYSKLKLVSLCKRFIVNLDDDKSAKIIDECKKHGIKEIYGISQKAKTSNSCISLSPKNIRKEGGYTVFELGDFGTIKLSMPGLFNVDNACFAAIMARVFGASNEAIARGLLIAKASGRMEIYKNSKEDIIGIVDFAHNKLSFEKIMDSTKTEYPGWTLQAVFGCPGSKAFERREDLPMVASRYMDYCYICEDDPFMEKAEDICKTVYENLTQFGGKGEIIVDRKNAIETAVKRAKPNTVILFLAKGCDTYMHRAEYDPYESDSYLVEKELKKY